MSLIYMRSRKTTEHNLLQTQHGPILARIRWLGVKFPEPALPTCSHTCGRVATRVTTWGYHMKISTVREFRDKATGYLRSKDPILVTRRGRLAGVFFPRPEASLPIEFKRELFAVLTTEVARQVRKRNLKEEEIVADFESWRKRKRETRRRR